MSLTRPALVLILALSFARDIPSACAHQEANAARKALANQDVVEMVKTGLPTEIVVAKIKSSACNFDTSPEKLKELKAAAVPDSVILAMVEASSTTADRAAVVESPKNEASTPEVAHLRVYRQRRYMGSALAPSIYVDDRQVTRVGNGRRCTIKLSPGPHSIRSDDKSSAISLDVKGGQEYFVRVDEETGFWKGHGKLTMLAPEQGGAEYKLQKPVEEERKIAKEMLEDDAAAADPKKNDATKKPN
jgi:hypothetical protein